MGAVLDIALAPVDCDREAFFTTLAGVVERFGWIGHAYSLNDDVGEMFAVFTPKRWELIGALRESGATTIAELARQLKRDYKNVYNDCERLIEWMAIEKDENGFVFAPYSQIVVGMKLPDRRAA